MKDGNLVHLAETASEDYLFSYAQIKHSFSKWFILLLLHSSWHDLSDVESALSIYSAQMAGKAQQTQHILG
jgi:hypothetical protein